MADAKTKLVRVSSAVNATSADSISPDLRSKKDASFPLSPRAVGFTRPRCISARALRALLTELAKPSGLARSVRSLAQSIKVIARSASSARNPNQLGIACAIFDVPCPRVINRTTAKSATKLGQHYRPERGATVLALGQGLRYHFDTYCGADPDQPNYSKPFRLESVLGSVGIPDCLSSFFHRTPTRCLNRVSVPFSMGTVLHRLQLISR